MNALGRGRKQVLLCDAGPRRNSAATHIHNFVTRDGTPPEEFRRIAREQLAAYPNVEVRDALVERIAGEKGEFRVAIGQDEAVARRILLGTGMMAVELESGLRVPCEALFAHPPQQQVALVRALGVVLDGDGVVQVDPMRRETSIPGVYAAGDLTTRAQGAILAAADGMRAAGMINLDLTADSIARGAPVPVMRPR